MIKAILALWAERDSDPGEVQLALLDRCAEAATGSGAIPRPLGIALNLADLESGERWDRGGPEGPMADAMVAVWARDDWTQDGTLAGFADALAGTEGVARLGGWTVEEHYPKRYERDWVDGEPTPGVKMMTLMRLAPGRSHEQCARHWREVHTGLALRIHVGMQHYVQNVVHAPLAGTDADSDVFGIVELHMRSREAFREERYDSEEGRREIYDDIPKFMALDRATGGYFSERILRTPPGEARGPS